jgi:hypothetical protein
MEQRKGVGQEGMEKYLGSSQGPNYAVQPLLLVSYRYVMGPGSPRVQEVGYESVDQIHLDQSMGQWAFANTIMDLQVPQKLQVSGLSQQQLRSREKSCFKELPV